MIIGYDLDQIISFYVAQFLNYRKKVMNEFWAYFSFPNEII